MPSLNWRLVAILIATFGLGAVLGWFWRDPRDQSNRATTHVLREVEVASFCANALNSLDGKREKRLRLLLESRMSSALEEAERSLWAVRLDSPTPNLLVGLDSAERYSRRWNKPDVAARAMRVKTALSSARSLSE